MNYIYTIVQCNQKDVLIVFLLHPHQYQYALHNVPDYESGLRKTKKKKKSRKMKTCCEMIRRKKMKCKPKGLSTDKGWITCSCFWSDTWFTQHTAELQSLAKNWEGLREKELTVLSHEPRVRFAWQGWPREEVKCVRMAGTAVSSQNAHHQFMPALTLKPTAPAFTSLASCLVSDCLLCHLKLQNTVYEKRCCCWNKQQSAPLLTELFAFH